MSEPYEPHLKRCRWCGADVEEEDYHKPTDSCMECYRDTPENRADVKGDQQYDAWADK